MINHSFNYVTDANSHCENLYKFENLYKLLPFEIFSLFLPVLLKLFVSTGRKNMRILKRIRQKTLLIDNKRGWNSSKKPRLLQDSRANSCNLDLHLLHCFNSNDLWTIYLARISLTNFPLSHNVYVLITS